MTSEFLDLARMESGRARLDISQFPLRKLINESVDVVIPQANSRNVTINVNCDEITVNGDRGKVKQVLLNLLTNAIKYNKEQGSIQVEATPVLIHDEPFIQLSVADTGYGISKEHQKHMFQKFYRVADTAGFAQGTGLGLAIAKHIVEAHGGNIWLESEQDTGSTFFVTLPIVR
jgi:signal transduction histidine kinase